jgi:hypothetical protein
MAQAHRSSHNSFDGPAPACRATLETLQRVLDGEANWPTLDDDAHLPACPACRERIRAAQLIISTLRPHPGATTALPSHLRERILDRVNADRRARLRLRWATVAGSLALAAAVLWAVGVVHYRPAVPDNAEVVQQSAPVPVAVPLSAPAPAPPAPSERVRLSEQWAKASESLWETPKPLAESIAVAPKLIDALAAPFTKPAAMPDPMNQALEPARKTLAELPSVARTGLEPITGTAEKAFHRFLRDLNSVKPNS